MARNKRTKRKGTSLFSARDCAAGDSDKQAKAGVVCVPNRGRDIVGPAIFTEVLGGGQPGARHPELLGFVKKTLCVYKPHECKLKHHLGE